MLLGTKILYDYIINGIKDRNGNATTLLVENIPEDFEIEGASVDMSLEELYIKRPINNILGAQLTPKSRNTGHIEVAAGFLASENFCFFIEPRKQYLGVTREKVNMPSFLLGKPMPRVTTFSSGLLIQVGIIQPGFSGKLKVGIVNMTDEIIIIEKGTRFITVTFEKICGETELYNGYHQGGDKISTHGEDAPPR